jgi:hypothetical protein
MSEPKAEYKTETAVESKENRCTKCDSDLGFESSSGHLIVGNWNVELIRGSCNVCGNPVKWYSTDWRMKQLLKGRKKSN